MDALYGYQAVNVEAQLNSTTSLLHWNRRMIEIRKRHHAFGLGDYRELGGSNPTVLAYMRTHGDDGLVLCVNNMSRFPSRWSWTCRRGRAACRTS
jgi:maltose alpha-D-glucosyltransferase/alpha-amylase